MSSCSRAKRSLFFIQYFKLSSKGFKTTKGSVVQKNDKFSLNEIKFKFQKKKNPQILSTNFEFKTCQAHADTTLNSSIHNPTCTQKAKPGLLLSQCITQCLQYKDWSNIWLLKSVSVECHNDILCKQLSTLFWLFWASQTVQYFLCEMLVCFLTLRNHKSTLNATKINGTSYYLPLRCSEGLFRNTDSNKRCGDTLPKKVLTWRACSVTF